MSYISAYILGGSWDDHRVFQIGHFKTSFDLVNAREKT